MRRQKPLPIGVFLHSLAADSIDAALRTSAANDLMHVQLGPVGDTYLIGDKAAQYRNGIVSSLARTGVSAAVGCFCFENANGRGGVEVYESIETIAFSGGFGYWASNAAEVLKDRLQIGKEHVDLFKFLRASNKGLPRSHVISTHVGFFDRPELSNQIKDNVRELVKYCARNGAYLAIESGSEPMAALVNFIQEIETETGITGRLGINYDPANFILYGTENPLEALHYLKNQDYRRLLFGVHIKDASGDEFTGAARNNWKGMEVPVGTGSVDWTKTILLLYALGYKGPLIIEREGELATESGNPVPFGPGGAARQDQRLYDIRHAARNTQRAQTAARSILLAS